MDVDGNSSSDAVMEHNQDANHNRNEDTGNGGIMHGNDVIHGSDAVINSNAVFSNGNSGIDSEFAVTAERLRTNDVLIKHCTNIKTHCGTAVGAIKELATAYWKLQHWINNVSIDWKKLNVFYDGRGRPKQNLRNLMDYFENGENPFGIGWRQMTKYIRLHEKWAEIELYHDSRGIPMPASVNKLLESVAMPCSQVSSPQNAATEECVNSIEDVSKLAEECKDDFEENHDLFIEIGSRMILRQNMMAEPYRSCFMSANECKSFEAGKSECNRCGKACDDALVPCVICREFVEANDDYDKKKVNDAWLEHGAANVSKKAQVNNSHPGTGFICVTCLPAHNAVVNRCLFCDAEPFTADELESIIWPSTTDISAVWPIQENPNSASSFPAITWHCYFGHIQRHFFIIQQQLRWMSNKQLTEINAPLASFYLESNDIYRSIDRRESMGFIHVDGEIYDGYLNALDNGTMTEKNILDYLQKAEHDEKIKMANVKMVQKDDGKILKEHSVIWVPFDYNQESTQPRDFVILLKANGWYTGGVVLAYWHPESEVCLIEKVWTPMLFDVASKTHKLRLDAKLLKQLSELGLCDGAKNTKWADSYFNVGQTKKPGETEDETKINVVWKNEPQFVPMNFSFDLRYSQAKNPELVRVKAFVGSGHIYDKESAKQFGLPIGVHKSGLQFNEKLLEALSCVELILWKAYFGLPDWTDIQKALHDLQEDVLQAVRNGCYDGAQLQLIGYTKGHGLAAHHDLPRAFQAGILIGSLLDVYLHFGDQGMYKSPELKWAVLFRRGDAIKIDKDCMLDTCFKHAVHRDQVSENRISYQMRLIADNYLSRNEESVESDEEKLNETDEMF